MGRQRRDPFLDDIDEVETTVELTCRVRREIDGSLLVRIVRPIGKAWEYLDVSRFVSKDELDWLYGEIQDKADRIIKKRGGFLKWLSRK